MTLRLFVNPTEQPLNAKAGQAIARLSADDVDVTTAELAAAIDSGLFAGPSRWASLIPAGAANGRLLVRAVEAGKYGRELRVAIVVAAGTVARSIAVAGKDITINPATTAGAINASETATALAAAINTDNTASRLIVAAVAEGDTGAGLVAAQALTALGPAAPVPLMDKNGRIGAGNVLVHSLGP